MKAIWNGHIIADSATTVVLRGTHYFPRESVVDDYVADSSQTSVCYWKGKANYLDIVVGGERNPGAAWYYAEPMEAAQEVKGLVAFWKGVEVVD